MKRENRILDPTFVSFRAIEEDGKRFLEGYASVFSQRSKLIYENGKFFYEVIDPKTFDEVLRDDKLDVKLNFNHANDKIIARTKSGTLKLSTDEKGLLFRAELPDVSYAKDVYELVSRGDLFENSFAFVVRKSDEEWSKDENGTLLRLVRKVTKLIDVAICVDGAYENTTISARDLQMDGRKLVITICEEEDDEDPIEELPPAPEMVMVDPSTGEEETISEDGCKKKRDLEEIEKYQMRTKLLKLKQI